MRPQIPIDLLCEWIEQHSSGLPYAASYSPNLANTDGHSFDPGFYKPYHTNSTVSSFYTVQSSTTDQPSPCAVLGNEVNSTGTKKQKLQRFFSMRDSTKFKSKKRRVDRTKLDSADQNSWKSRDSEFCTTNTFETSDTLNLNTETAGINTSSVSRLDNFEWPREAPLEIVCRRSFVSSKQCNLYPPWI